jgi:hypothetical protein
MKLWSKYGNLFSSKYGDFGFFSKKILCTSGFFFGSKSDEIAPQK